eukprot:CAMPEP_0114231166 /NCGR_PEP_ID=MMETSP0058-20121206/3883_1 /TAXON_ID=36894 /ORGANISM="Pyramimonas parkeae, CCMP726" /LENGTH=784 /DNA_ID=CAMNT_0001342465 /DNA_START=568 /DNA_END=2921 /DNA_ORIENTATION=+
MVNEFVGQTDYAVLIENIWREFPEMNIPQRVARAMNASGPIQVSQATNMTLWDMRGLTKENGELLDPEVFLRMKIAEAQHKLCQATLWVLVDKKKISRTAAVSAEPICEQLKQMMKVVDLENVVQKGTNALTLEQKGMLNGMMGRTMQDVFKSAYQNDVLFSPPSAEGRRQRGATDERPLEENEEEGWGRAAGGARNHGFPVDPPGGAGDRDAPDDVVGKYAGESLEDLAALSEDLIRQREAAVAQDDRLAAAAQVDRLAAQAQDDRLSAAVQVDRLAAATQDDRLAAATQDNRLAAVAQDDRLAAVFTRPPGVWAAAAALLAKTEERAACKKHDLDLENVLRLRYCQMESTVRNPAGATLLEALSASLLQMQRRPPAPPDGSNSNSSTASSDPQIAAMSALSQRLRDMECRLLLVGSTDAQFPLFLEKTLDAVNLPHCRVTVYEPNPRYKTELQTRFDAEGVEGGVPLRRTRIVMSEVTQAKGSYQVEMPGPPTIIDAAHAVDLARMRDAAGNEVFVAKQQVHHETVFRISLDQALCEPISVSDVPRQTSTNIAFCEVGETPLVTIAAHADPLAVLLSFRKMLHQAHPAAVLWEASFRSDISDQIKVFARTDYIVYAGVLQPPNIVVGHHEPQLVRVDIDENAISTIKGLMQYYKLNITLAAIRHTHPFLEHAKDRLVLCENPCHGGASLSRFLGEQERSKTNTDSCPVPDICMCSGLDPPAPVALGNGGEDAIHNQPPAEFAADTSSRTKASRVASPTMCYAAYNLDKGSCEFNPACFASAS